LPTTEEKQRIYILRKELEKQSVVSWVRVYEEFPEIPRNQVRKIYFRELMKRGEHPSQQKPPTVSVQGVTPAYEEINEDDIWEQAVLKSRRVREINGRRHDQHITFSHGPVCLVFLADLHLGDTGVDYERLDDDIETIVETPGMYVVLVGDALNNFIVGRLKDIRMGAEFSISEEWVMVKRVLRKLAPKMIMSVSGNHDLWTFALTAVDYLEEIHARINPDILYSKYDNQVTVSVGEEVSGKVIHNITPLMVWSGQRNLTKAGTLTSGSLPTHMLADSIANLTMAERPDMPSFVARIKSLTGMQRTRGSRWLTRLLQLPYS
jgi:hypothetical protein